MNEKFIQRSLTTLVGLPIVILIIWINSYKNIPILVIFTSIIAFFAIYEICKMAKKENIHINPIITSFWGAILIFSATGIHSNINLNIVYLWLLAKISLLLLLLGISKLDKKSRTLFWIISICGPFYVSGLLAFAPIIRNLEQNGFEWLLLIFLSTSIGDTFALIFGKFLGKKMLAPSFSPTKTWEGAIANLAGSILTTTIVYELTLSNTPDSIPIIKILLLGIGISIFGQIGDLMESKIKRLLNTKNSSDLIPGHGGVLDRIDSIVFNLPLVYYFLKW
ncbi:MAG: phosphatidate cytidylyltransferase [Dehalococcoidia bacterium]